MEHLKTKRHCKDVEEILGTKLEADKEQMKAGLQKLFQTIEIKAKKQTEN